jgi:hypothetical protein
MNSDWRKFTFVLGKTPFEQNYNYLQKIDPCLAVAYVCLPKSDTNNWKRQMNTFMNSSTIGNVLIGAFTEPGPAPWERVPGTCQGWFPPKASIQKDGQTFVADGKTYVLPLVNPEHVKKAFAPWINVSNWWKKQTP